MRVLFINRNYLTTALHQTMIEHLEKLNVTCDVFAPAAKEDISVITPNSNVTKCICYSRLERPLYHIKQFRIKNAIEKNYDLNCYDLVHAGTVFTDGNCAYQLYKKFGIPYIVAFRDTDFTFFKLRFDLRKRGLNILMNSQAIIFLSESLLNRFLNVYIPSDMQDYIRKKAYIIPNGIDDFWIDNKINSTMNNSLERIKNKELRILYAGRITQNKNIDLTLKAIEIVREKGWNCSFTVIGKVFDSQTYNKIIKFDNVHYIEPQMKEALISYYRESDIFVMPSHHETFGLVYAEAMSQGLPVIYTRGQGFDGQFEEGFVGYSVSDEDSIELSEKIIKVADNYPALSRNAFESVDIFQWNRICTEYVDLYQSIIQ